MVAAGESSLTSNLVLLQSLIKRDPVSYEEEFVQRYDHYRSVLRVFSIQPGEQCSHLVDLISFISQVIHCYPDQAKGFPKELMELIEKHHSLLQFDLRMSLCKSIVLLRNKGLVNSVDVLKLFFDLFRCPDKQLRKYLFQSIIAHIKHICLKLRDQKLNSQLRNYVYSKLQHTHGTTARMALLMMIDLYRKNIWNDATTVNVIASACCSKSPKVVATALKFFTGTVDETDEAETSESEDEGETKTLKEVMVAYKVGKKSKKRKKQLEKAKEAISKQKKRKKAARNLGSSAILLFHDPQEFVERLFKRLDSSTDRYELKLLMMGLIAKTIGVHQLVVLNFYPFLQKYLQPHQREVTKVLLYAAQATHELVPPDTIEALIRCIVNNFVTERNSPEVMTVGLNTVKEICQNCPMAINEDLLHDLTGYKTYKNKNVVMAARALIQLYRTNNPQLLRRKDRGRPTEFTRDIKPVAFGETVAEAHVPGSEILAVPGTSSASCGDEGLIAEHGANEKDNGDSGDDGDDCDDDDDGGVDVDFSEEDADTDAEEGEIDEDEKTVNEKPALVSQPVPSTESHNTSEMDDSLKETASKISSDRVFSQEDFHRIRSYQLKRRIQPAIGKKRKTLERVSVTAGDASSAVDADGSLLLDEDSDDEERQGLFPKLSDIEKLSKRSKQDKAAIMATIMGGREGREKFGRPKKTGPHVGKTKRQATKRKAFTMVKHKQRGKKKRSFRDKQIALRKHLLHRFK